MRCDYKDLILVTAKERLVSVLISGKISTHYLVSQRQYSYEIQNAWRNNVRSLKLNWSRWSGEDQNSKYHWTGSELTIFSFHYTPARTQGSLNLRSRQWMERQSARKSPTVHSQGAGKGFQCTERKMPFFIAFCKNRKYFYIIAMNNFKIPQKWTTWVKLQQNV